MCTAVSFTTPCGHFFGRTLDYDFDFGEQIVITPRNFPFLFRNGECIKNHPAIIGMAVIKNNFPLYFDAVNENGLGIAALNFPANARYNQISDKLKNIASFELIPFLLCSCKTVAEVKKILPSLNITDDAFDRQTPPSPLHWLIADKFSSIVLEVTESGMHIYDNPVGVLTNNPTFDMQLFNLSQYPYLSNKEPDNTLLGKLNINPCSRGNGALGLPGDFSSPSRFVRACFVKLNSLYNEDEGNSVTDFFRILSSVSQPRGCVKSGDNWVITHYSSCCDTKKGIYYYTTYNNMSPTAIDIHREDLAKNKLISYPLLKTQSFYTQNR